MSDATSLDDPVGESMRGAHAHLCRRVGEALAYEAEVATFVAVPRVPSEQDWDDLAALLGRGGFVDLFSAEVVPPPDWPPVFRLEGVQMVLPEGVTPVTTSASRDDVVKLNADDVTDMIELAAATQPGPFWTRTVEMGRFVGVREGGRLVAMAGERLRPPGWVEISSVCTAEDARGRGLAAHLVATLGAGILDRGGRPFLHVARTNVGAIALYERLGFVHRRDVTFHGVRVSGD